MDGRQFLDLEAAVEEEEEDVLIYSDEDLNSPFIVDDDVDDDASGGHHEYDQQGVVQAMHSNQTLSTTNDAEELERIAKSIRARAATSSSSNTTIAYGESDFDIPLWEIGVPPGKERVYAQRLRRSPVFEKRKRTVGSSTQTSRERIRGREGSEEERARPGHLYDVFAVPLLSGRVYIQSRDRSEVFRRLETLKNNAFKQPTLVPPSEIAQILQLRRRKKAIQPTTSSGQWVRLKDGLYDGDIGLVQRVYREDNDPVKRYEILVVPRIDVDDNPYSNDPLNTRTFTESIRPYPRLVRFAEVQKRVGKGNVHGAEDDFTVFSERFRHSLHVISKPKSECSLVQCPSANELEHFSTVRINTIAATNKSFLCVMDRVRVFKGTFQGCKGVVELLGDAHATLLLDVGAEASSGQFRDQVAYDEFERVFEAGDLVEIMLGPHSGKTGMIASVSSDSLEIECGRTSQSSEDHEEKQYEVVDSVIPAFVRSSVENKKKILRKHTSSTNDIAIGMPVVVLHGAAKGVADLYSYDEKEVVVFSPNGPGLVRTEPQYVVSGDWLLNGQEPYTFDGQQIVGHDRKELREQVKRYVESRPRALAGAKSRQPGLDERIGQPVWIFKGERKGVAELQGVGKDHALVYFPGRIHSFSEISLDSAVSSVDWRLLNDEVIDVDADYSARIAVAEYLGLSVPADSGSGGDGTLADNETICIGDSVPSNTLPKTSGPAKSPRSMRAVRGALVRATGEEGDYSDMEWLSNPIFLPLLCEYSFAFRIKRHRSESYWGVPVRTLVDSVPVGLNSTGAKAVKNQTVPFIRVKFRALSGYTDRTEDLTLSSLTVHEPKTKDTVIVVRGPRCGELLVVLGFEEERSKCWVRPLNKDIKVRSHSRSNKFLIPASDVTKIEPHVRK